MLHRRYCTELEERLKNLLGSARNCRRQDQRRIDLIQSNMKSEERIRKALFEGADIEQVAKDFDLKVSTVPRLSAKHRSHKCDQNWSWQNVVPSWGLECLAWHLTQNGQLARHGPIPRKQLVAAVGPNRIRALMAYTGMSRDAALRKLSRQLPRLIELDSMLKKKGIPVETLF